jgi:hypothetical protein
MDGKSEREYSEGTADNPLSHRWELSLTTEEGDIVTQVFAAEAPCSGYE